jgi:uncharacterized membrane protein YidH (DUF202 family)
VRNVAFQQRGQGATIEFCTVLPPNKHLQPTAAEAGSVASHGLSAYLGGALVGLGVLATAGGTVQYQRFCRTLSLAERPASASPRFILGLSWALVVIGTALGIVLLV